MRFRILRYLHRRIIVQVAILLIVAIGLFIAVAYDAAEGAIGIIPVILAALAGIAVGYAAGRMFILRWHEDTRKVILRMDRTGFILIAAYIVFRIVSGQLLGEYFDGAALSAISFAVIDGVLIGRLLSLWRGIGRVLLAQGVAR
ncbi:MAG TPA: hypothetical protein VFL98_03805 [Candidatus Paceibacterota bacterium]|nr:hypothetical protein [Candidatus Paceibacterota bacterium]